MQNSFIQVTLRPSHLPTYCNYPSNFKHSPADCIQCFLAETSCSLSNQKAAFIETKLMISWKKKISYYVQVNNLCKSNQLFHCLLCHSLPWIVSNKSIKLSEIYTITCKLLNHTKFYSCGSKILHTQISHVLFSLHQWQIHLCNFSWCHIFILVITAVKLLTEALTLKTSDTERKTGAINTLNRPIDVGGKVMWKLMWATLIV